MTLVGFLRGSSMVVYSGGERVVESLETESLNTESLNTESLNNMKEGSFA
jgi:hypothetical protein